MAYVNAACTGHVTIFSTGGKFCLGLNFTLLHGLTLAAHCYALLSQYIGHVPQFPMLPAYRSTG